MFRTIRFYYAIFYVALLYLPIAFIPLFSFNDSVYVAFPWRGFTTKWYEALGSSDGLLASLCNSLIVATVAAVISTVVSTMAAIAATRYSFAGRRLLMVALAAPIAVPAVVVAVSMLSLFSIVGVPLSLATIIFGHILICVPFSFGVLAARFEGINPDLELASADLGEPPLWTFWRVTLPLAAPGIVSSFLLSFTISFDEFILAFFLASNSPTLPVYMWSQMRFPDRLPTVLALATLLLLFSAILMTISLRLRQSDSNLIPR